MRVLFVAENDGMAEIDDALRRAREPYEVLARIRWSQARGTLDESAVDLFERLHRVRAEHDRRSWHICLMIAIDRGECLREDGAIDWVAVEAWLGRCPEGKRSRGAPGASPDKKRLLGEAVEILKTRGRFSLNDACSIVAEVVRFTRHVRNPARTIEEAWREYSCGKPDGDGRRVYRYAMLRLEGEPSLWAALDRLDASSDDAPTSKHGDVTKKNLINPVRHLQNLGRPSCLASIPEHADAVA